MKKDLSLYCLKYAESVLPESMVFYCGSTLKQIPISFAIYLIETDNKKILVDAGCDTMPDFDMKKFYSPAFILRKAGIKTSEITDVVITHSHHDHIEGIKHFRNATIHITKEEYQCGENYFSDNMKTNIVDAEFEIENGVKIIKISGHSVGSAIVEVSNDDIKYIIAGDECYSNECIKRKIQTGCYYNSDNSKYFIEKYSDSKYNVLTMHDINLKTERII